MFEMIKGFFTDFIYYLTYPIRILMMPDAWARGLRRFTRVSFPVGIALLVALFLIVCVVSFYIAATKFVPRSHFFDEPWWKTAPVVGLLVVVIPIVTYYCVKLWLEGDWSAFEDIDRAWKAGLDELNRHGLDLRKIPIFLVHGSENTENEENLFAASGLSLTVNNFPPGPSALHWYANRDGIFIVASDVGCLSHIAARADKLAQVGPTVRTRTPRPEAAGVRQTVWPSELQRAPEPELQAAAAAPARPPSNDIRATIMMNPEADVGTAAAAVNKIAGRNKLSVDRREIDVQRRRMEHLCRLIRRVRRPLCPVNGVLTLLPLNLLLADDEEGNNTKEAARVDVDTMVKTLKLRCPVTAVVTGWEAEIGFHELIRRLEPQVPGAARQERFGKGFEVWAPPVPEEMGALCKQACFAFEWWVYQMFKERDALRRPGNRSLYALICRVRLYLEQRLDRILVGAFAHEEGEDLEPLLFGGCYFVAAGAVEDRQAFVRSVMNKLPDQQEELEWTMSAVRDDQWFRRLAWVGWTLVLGMLIAEGLMLYTRLKH